MDRRVYRPFAAMGISQSFMELLSQDSIGNTYDDILDINNMSRRSPEDHPNIAVASERHTSNDIASQSNHVDIPLPARGRVRWSVSDTFVLIDAKRVEKDLHMTGGAMRKTQTATERWKSIEKYCFDNGIARSATQCRDRWEHIMPEYKKVRDYEKNIPSGHISYWAMTSKERMDKKLPVNFNEELYGAMDNSFGHDRSINPGNMHVDTSGMVHEVPEETPAPDQNMRVPDSTTAGLPCQSNNSNPYDMSDTSEKQSTGKRRRSTSKITSLKDVMTESSKLIASNLEIAEEGRAKRHAEMMERYDRSEDRHDRSEDRRYRSDERMFAIEEKKLKVQEGVVSALNLIGEAMLKLNETLGKK